MLAGGECSWPLPAACPSRHRRLGWWQTLWRPEPAPRPAATAVVQEEAEAVTAQLEAASAQYQAARAEGGDVVGQWQQDRQDLEEQIRWVMGWKEPAGASTRGVASWPTVHPWLCCRALHSNLALKNLVIDAFIPQEEVSKVSSGGRPGGC